VLSLDLGGLGSGVLVDELKSVLVLTSLELILLVGNSVLVGLQVGIGGSLGSGGGGEVSGLSGVYEVSSNLGIISLEGSIKSSLLGLNGGGVGSLSTGESSLVLVGGTGESGSGISLSRSSSGVGTGLSGGISTSGTSGSSSTVCVTFTISSTTSTTYSS